MTRRTVRTLAIALVLGAVINVLVTAWCVYAGTTDPSGQEYGRTIIGGVGVHWSQYEGRWKTVVAWEARSLPADPVDDKATPPAWSSAHDAGALARVMTAAGPSGWSAQRLDMAYGWPMRSFRGSITRFAGQLPPDEHEFIPLSPLPVPSGLIPYDEPRTVPLEPMVPGLLANTALYGGLWWALLLAPRVLRHRKRRRRGACIGCGYDRRGIAVDAACPECGAAANVVQ